MGGRHGPPAIQPGDELIEVLIDRVIELTDEVKGLRADLAPSRATAGPQDPPPAAEPAQPDPEQEPVTIAVTEPAEQPTPAKPPRKRTPRKAAPTRKEPSNGTD